MNLRLSTLLLMLMIVAGAFGVYMVKYQVQDMKKEIAHTEHLIAEEHKNIHVLQAEWAYLTRPDRIKRLADKYLDVKPLTGKQVTELASLPEMQENPAKLANQEHKPNQNTSLTLINKVVGDDE